MIWKLLGLQKKLDALFDDGWVSLGLSHTGFIATAPERPNAASMQSNHGAVLTIHSDLCSDH